MRIRETELAGAYVLEPVMIEDERGAFTTTFCERELAAAGIVHRIVQSNVSQNRRKGTLRGMHWQVAPHAQAKLVRCTRGSIHDVIVDLRQGSATFGRWTAVELTASNRLGLLVPAGMAHGFLTLEDDSEVFYEMAGFYDAPSARGARYDDPSFGIRWPGEVTVISARDRSYPDYRPS